MKIKHTSEFEPDFGIVETLKTALTALERGFALDSPLDPLFRAAIEILSLLAVRISRDIAETKPSLVRDPVFEVKPALIGKQLHRNWFDDSLSFIPDPLVDFRDEVKVIDPNTGREEVILTSNPVYHKKRLPDLILRQPKQAQAFLWDIAEILTSMVRGSEWSKLVAAHLRSAQAKIPKKDKGIRLDSPPRTSPEGGRIDSPIGYYQRRRLSQKRQRHRK